MHVPLHWFAWFHVFRIASCIYYHEPSHVIITDEESGNHTQFGFSLGYQAGSPGKLIIGAPHYDENGKVFSCSLDNIFSSKSSSCNKVDINITSLAGEYSRIGSPNQKFMLGASIAATPNYFLTCAPLWSSEIEKIGDSSKKNFFVFGTCFVYNGTAYRYKGLYETYSTHENYNALFGSTGWRTLVDNTNNILMISKPATPTLFNDVLYVSLDTPLEPVNLLALNKNKILIDQSRKTNKEYLTPFRNLGAGIASGTFFSNNTIYAISYTDQDVCGVIVFLKYGAAYKKRGNKLSFLKKIDKQYVTLEDQTPGSMFGVALNGRDLNKDGLSELIVGAPAYTEDDSMSDAGAIYIYLGGDINTVNDEDRMRMIISTKDGSRFGTSITTNDLDGDGLPEIFVSAPYENLGEGALYILSGYEIYDQLMKHASYKQIYLSNLKMTQRIQSSVFRAMGFSLQIMPDIDENGCDELAVGSPGNAKVMLLRCIPSVKIHVTTKVLGAQIVREQDNTFTVQVCVNMTHQSKIENTTNKISVKNEIIGTGASIEPKYEKFYIDLSEKKETYCQNITVLLSDNEAADYRFFAEADVEETIMRNTTEFNKSWVSVNPASKLKANVLEISRHCSGDDCRPSLTMSLDWSGRNQSHYTLGSTLSENVTIQVRNDGKSAYEACVWVYVVGAQVAQIGCTSQDGGYLCNMPKPFKRNTEHLINMKLNMSGFSNLDKFMKVTVHALEFCKDSSNATQKNLEVLLVLNTNDVYLDGVSRNETLTDKKMLDKKIQTINVAHEYKIINNGTVTWKNLEVKAAITEKPYIDLISSWVHSTEAITCDKNLPVTCRFDLMPHSTVKIISTVVVPKNLIVANLQNNTLDISTNISLILHATSVLPDSPSIVKELRLSSAITFHKELTLGQDKNLIILIAVILALVILTLIIFVLWKLDFFKRKQKEELIEQKRRMSVKQSTSSRDDEKFYMDVELEDDAFETAQNAKATDKVHLHEKTEEKADVLI